MALRSRRAEKSVRVAVPSFPSPSLIPVAAAAAGGNRHLSLRPSPPAFGGGSAPLTVRQRQRSTGILRYLITRLTLSHEMKFICGRLTQNPLDFFEELCSRDFKLICRTKPLPTRPPAGPSTLHNKQGGISDLMSWSHIVSPQMSAPMLLDGNCSCLTSVVFISRSNFVLFWRRFCFKDVLKKNKKTLKTHLKQSNQRWKPKMENIIIGRLKTLTVM